MHKLTIEQVSLYFDTENPKYLTKKIWKKSFLAKFMIEFNTLFGGEYNFNDEKYKIWLYNRAFNVLPALHEALRLAIIGKNKRLIKRFLKEYEAEIGKKFKKISDLNAIKEKINILRSKYKAYEGEKAPEKMDFEKLIIAVEGGIGYKIDRSTKMYQFKGYYDKAIANGRDTTVPK